LAPWIDIHAGILFSDNEMRGYNYGKYTDFNFRKFGICCFTNSFIFMTRVSRQLVTQKLYPARYETRIDVLKGIFIQVVH
jgi:hypothetical protein